MVKRKSGKRTRRVQYNLAEYELVQSERATRAHFPRLSPETDTVSPEDYWKEGLFYFTDYMIQSGKYGRGVCAGMGGLFYDVDTGRFDMVDRAFVWAMTDCPFDMVFFLLALNGETVNHANCILVNKSVDPWEIERFEPHGTAVDFYDMARLDRRLERMVGEMLEGVGQEITYKSPVMICPRPGPQATSEAGRSKAGYCQTWIMFYLHARLFNSTMSAEEVLYDLTSHTGDEQYAMIHDYVRYVKNMQIPAEFLEISDQKNSLRIGLYLFEKKLEESSIHADDIDQICHRLYSACSKTEDIVRLKSLSSLIRDLPIALEMFPAERAIQVMNLECDDQGV